MKQNWTGQSILIIGAARQGLALARFLAARGAQVTLNDMRTPDQMKTTIQSMREQPGGERVQWALSGHPLDLLDQADLVCISGGVPLSLPIIQEAAHRGLPLTNDSQIFMEAVQAAVIGITGSAGKTTTTTLVGRMAEAYAGEPGGRQARKAWLGGNIGRPLVEYVDEIQPVDLVVVELSSFQLELMTISPWMSVVLNITPNHLDRHGTLAEYTAAKARILKFQSREDIAVLNRDDPGAWELRSQVAGRLVSFGWQRPISGEPGTFLESGQIMFCDGQRDMQLMSQDLVRLRGEHNLRNVLAACAIACAASWPVHAIRRGVQDFTGVAHRLELVAVHNGAAWYNDSIATAPERTIAAIEAFEEPLILLLGGRDKNLPWDKLAGILQQRVKHVVLFGEAAGKIQQAIGGLQTGIRLETIRREPNLRAAVQAAASLTQAGDVVLLSPGGTSFDEFSDFEERGERFREWVNALL